MARLKETYLASDQMDYRRRETGDRAITREHAKKGFAATIGGGAEAGKKTNRPVAELTDGDADVIIGAVTSVGEDGCNVVRDGRFVLQAVGAGDITHLRRKIVGDATDGNEGKVAPHGGASAVPADFAQQGELAIIGFDNDTTEGGIGHHYLVERL